MCTDSNVHAHLDKRCWRKRKGAFVRLVSSTLHQGICVARVTSTSMVSNTCCTALLLQGAAVSSDASPP